MTAAGIVRDFTCAVCGGPRQTIDRALLVLCRHCGAILTFAGDGLRHEATIGERHAAGIQQMVRPTTAQARLMALGLEMARATTDRPRWRLLAEEQILIMALVHPTQVMPVPAEPHARTRYVKDALVIQEIATFDPHVTSLMSGYANAAMKLTHEDPVLAAREMLAAGRAYYRAIIEHPDTPPGTCREGADHLAREMVRAGIGGYASLLGMNAIERIRSEVLGDERTTENTCPKCGGPLDSGGPLDAHGAGLTRCRHCSAVTSIVREDAWTTAQLGIWGITRKELVRRNDLDGPAPVIAAVGGFLWTSAATVAAASAAQFLRRAIPWVATAALLKGLEILAHGTNEEQRRLLDGIRAELVTWTPDPSQRPTTRVSVTDFPPPTPEDEAAWIDSTLALYRYRGGPLLEMLGHCLGAMQAAAVHETAAGVSPRAAMTFFERAAPGYDRTAMLATLTPLIPGYDLPRVRAFTTELARLLSTGE